jgi:hypothetical protein
MRKAAALVATVVLITAVAFARRAAADGTSSDGRCETPASAALLVLGQRPKAHWNSTCTSVKYQIKEEYPARLSLESIKSTLNRLRWSPSVKDLLDPSQPTSYQAGWSNFVRGGERIFQWRAWWQDGAGNAVLYQLEFAAEGTESRSPRPLLSVNAVYVDAATLVDLQTKAKHPPVP